MKRYVALVLLWIGTLVLPFGSRALAQDVPFGVRPVAQGEPAPSGQHDEHGAMTPGQIGSASVKFETSCAAAVKDDFNKAVAVLHSFGFPVAIDMFNVVLKKDPTCAMAYWGIALSQWNNPFAGIKNPQTVETVRATIEKAKATGLPTRRERALIDAVVQLTTVTDPGSHLARITTYEAAMAKAAADYPNDKEIRIFSALAICQAAADYPTDRTYARQLKAAAILEPLFKQMPAHPGLAHYIIHAYDVPPLAPMALDAARRYASIAPAIPHALHMPSHTFTRLGYWKESIETNRKAAEAARKNGSLGVELHALDYQTYAYLQLAQDKAAKGAVDRAFAIVKDPRATLAQGAFAAVAIPTRYALERGAWTEAGALPGTTTMPFVEPFVEAISHFARAIGAARSGNPAAATPDIERLATLRDRLQEMKDVYWTEQVDIQRRAALAWQTFAQANREEGIRQMQAAADAEDATDKSAISPGLLAPARELLGDMLLDADRAQEALAAYEATMKKEPNRFRGIYGAARAAEAAGDNVKAREYYRKLLDLAKDADTERPELQRARKFLSVPRVRQAGPRQTPRG